MTLLTQGETYDRMFGIDWQLLADSTLTIIAVVVLFGVMSYFLFNPARKMLNDRKEKIAGELAQAKADMDVARSMREEYESRLKAVDKEADGILSEARKKGLENENRIVADAKEEANAILERARVEAQLEKSKISDEVKKEIIEVAGAMAGKLVAASLDPETQDKLLDDTLKEMDDKTWLK